MDMALLKECASGFGPRPINMALLEECGFVSVRGL